MENTAPQLISRKAMGIVLLTIYASLFVIVPFFAIYNGWVYIIGCLFFGLGLRWQLDQILARGHVDIGIHYLNTRYLWDPRHKKEDRFQWFGTKIYVTSDKWLTLYVSTSLTTIAILILPILVWVMIHQGNILNTQIGENAGEITNVTEGLITTANERFGTTINISQEGSLMDLITQVAGGAINDVKNVFKYVLQNIAQSIGHFFADWLKVTIATFIIGAFISPGAYPKMVQTHNKIIRQGFAWNEAAGETVIRGGKIFQKKLGQFMVGYLEVVARLIAMFFVVIYILAPSGLGILAAIGISVFLGFITAVPKIGGLIGMVLGAALMALNLKTGLGWFGFEMFSTGSAYADTFIRMLMLGTIAKVIGLFEAYKFTPEIVGKKLGLDKIQIVFVVVMYAFGSIYWMIWGIIGLCALAAAMQLADEVQAFWEKNVKNQQQVA